MPTEEGHGQAILPSDRLIARERFLEHFTEASKRVIPGLETMGGKL